MAVLLIALKSFVPALENLDKTGILLCSTIAFFVFNILKIDDLEDIPWNIILLFAGAMSIGFCLWETGAAKWMAVNWLVLFQKAPAIVFILGMLIIVVGIALMIWQSVTRPAFFRGETLATDAPASTRRLKEAAR